MKTKIIADNPMAHEDVMRAWTRGQRCVVVPHGFEDPSSYIEAHPGGAGLFLYMANAQGGYDLTHVSWQQLQARLEGRVTRPFMTGRVLSMFDNRWGYGLVLGRLYTLYHGGTVVPYRGSPRMAARAIANGEVDTVIGIVDLLLQGLTYLAERGERWEAANLKTALNVCMPLGGSSQAELAALLGCEVRNLFGLGRCGIIAMSDGRVLEENEQGDLAVEAKLDGEQLLVRSGTTYPDYDLGEGWCATGKRARIDGQRLFIDGDIGV